MLQTMIAYPKLAVIQPYGSFNASSAAEFQRQIKSAVTEEGRAGVLVDLQLVESIDSAGLMALVHGLRVAKTLGRRFTICSVSPSLQMIFELTQLDRVFEIFENIAAFEDAIASYALSA